MYALRLHGDADDLMRKIPDQALAAPGLVQFAAGVTLENAQHHGAAGGRHKALELARKAVKADPASDRNQALFGLHGRPGGPVQRGG